MKKRIIPIILTVLPLALVCTAIIHTSTQPTNHQDEVKEEQAESTPASPEEIKKQLSATTKIVVEGATDHTITKTITNQKEIKTIIDIFSRAHKETGSVTFEGNNWNLTLYDINGKLIYTVSYWSGSSNYAYIGLTSSNKEYRLAPGDTDTLLKIIQN